MPNLFSQNTEHLFVYLEEVLNETPRITYGNFKNTGSLLVKDSIAGDDSFFYNKISKTLSNLPVEKQNILIHIHGLWADQKSFYEEANHVLQEKIFDHPDSKYGLIISLQWHGTVDYILDYEITDRSGQLFENILNNIDSTAKVVNYDYRLSFVNHSMGNKVFYAILENDLKSEVQLDINTIMLCAADLKDTILQNEVMLDYVISSDKTVIFYNPKDRTLRMAKFAVPGDRLGISGPSNTRELPPSVEIYDVSDYNDFETRSGKYSKHRYYYDSAKARKIIREGLE